MDEPEKMNLIKTVRGLDQTGPGENGSILEALWKRLIESSDDRFHAAEESALRWLLKSMNGPSPNAEILRRYPLTWTILDCVFLRIPLFSLAKSLADRRFVSVLQQTLKDISKPTQAPGSRGAKRKRWPTPRFDLDVLRGVEGCLATAQAVFTLLRSLLTRLNDEAGGSRARLGAEHIKSLFSASATEAATISAAGLTLCGLLLSSDACDGGEGQHNWIATISELWDLHLQGADDTLEVATHLFRPAVSILARTEAFPQRERRDVGQGLAARWSADLQRFMHRNLILPARAAFLHRQDFEAMTRALDVAADQTGLASPVLYFLAAGATGDTRKGNATWMRQIFQAADAHIRKLPEGESRSTLMMHILGQAASKSIDTDVEDVRAVCRDYGLKDGETDWRLVASAAACNPEIFQVAKSQGMLKEVCERSVQESAEGDCDALSDLIMAIQKGFCMRRSFFGFLKLWFEQLCLAETRKLSSSSPWFQLGQKDSPSSLIETELTPALLLEVVEWLEGQERSHPRALCVVADAIARGLHSEPFTDAIGTRLFDLVAPLARSKATALKWRVVSRTASWVSTETRGRIWAQVKDELSKMLRKKPVLSAQAFEGLKCCYQMWDSMSLDNGGEPAALIDKFTTRLAEDLASQGGLEPAKLPSSPDSIRASSDYDGDCALQQYVAWYLLGSSRFLKLYWSQKGELPPAVDAALSIEKDSIDGLRTLWTTLMRNDVNLNDAKLSRSLLSRLISAGLPTSEEQGAGSWLDGYGRMWIQTLSSVPSDAFTRQQREQVMTILEQRRAQMAEASLEGWTLVLDLSTKMMSRPTFHEGLHFSNLVRIADALSEFPFGESSDETLLQVVERFFVMASTTIRQMAEHNDARSVKYFAESLAFISDCDGGHENLRGAALRVTLLKALAAELGRSSSQQQSAKGVLARRIASIIGAIMDGKLLPGHDKVADLSLFAAVDAAPLVDDFTTCYESSAVRRLETSSSDLMSAGDLRGWKMQIFLHTYLSSALDMPRPTRLASLSKLPLKSRERLLKQYVAAIVKDLDPASAAQYLTELISEFTQGHDTDGQILAIQHVVDHLLEHTDLHGKAEGVDLAAAHSELTFALAGSLANTDRTCRALQTLLERKPQAMGQWNVEVTLGTVARLASAPTQHHVSFAWLCKLVGAVIRKHRLRLEGHYHLLVTAMQALLGSLVGSAAADGTLPAARAQLYGRLVTLVCEPSAGAVSRSQHQSALDSATDAAKRSAGRHMYLVMMHYVKQQLEASVAGEVREALEPAMNSIFDITPPEVRKILNDAMDGSGRAILREMYKRYTMFGKWNGV